MSDELTIAYMSGLHDGEAKGRDERDRMKSDRDGWMAAAEEWQVRVEESEKALMIARDTIAQLQRAIDKRRMG